MLRRDTIAADMSTGPNTLIIVAKRLIGRSVDQHATLYLAYIAIADTLQRRLDRFAKQQRIVESVMCAGILGQFDIRTGSTQPSEIFPGVGDRVGVIGAPVKDADRL